MRTMDGIKLRGGQVADKQLARRLISYHIKGWLRHIKEGNQQTRKGWSKSRDRSLPKKKKQTARNREI